MNLTNEIKDRLSIFNNIYDSVRIVDPIKNKTIFVDEHNVKELGGTCFDFWDKKTCCENCISARAYNAMDTFVKIEHTSKKTYLITASPVSYMSKLYVVEMLKDITDRAIVVNDNSSTTVEGLVTKMNERITRDELTGAYNRRYINEKLPIEIKKSLLDKNPISVIMADIDFFKRVNDDYGHLIGDRVLANFAEIIKNNIREEDDWVGRYGGEEFLIVLRNTNSNEAYKISEKIRMAVEEHIFKYNDINLKITSSFGVYSISNEKAEANQLISGADKNLYEAKAKGRNRTIV